VQELSVAIHEAQETVQQQQQQVTQLQQQVNDAAEERRLVEKKGVVVTRDLRRQLASERRRVEKLQERLRDLNSENKVNTSLSDMNHRGGMYLVLIFLCVT
jgi:predicted RNase H-like nuclease (RuvC/YqgF family)